MLPRSLKDHLNAHIEKTRALHKEDRIQGYGEVYLPYALDRKYPNAAREWKWQYVFPSLTLSIDPRSGKKRRHHLSASSVRTAIRKAVIDAGIEKPRRQRREKPIRLMNNEQ